MIINGFIYKLILGYIQLSKCYEGLDNPNERIWELTNIDRAMITIHLGLKFNPENGDLLNYVDKQIKKCMKIINK